MLIFGVIFVLYYIGKKSVQFEESMKIDIKKQKDEVERLKRIERMTPKTYAKVRSMKNDRK